jgi:hypothetical protein
MGEVGGLNIYAYCGGDPIDMIDPLGLCSPGGRDINIYVVTPRDHGNNFDSVYLAFCVHILGALDKNGYSIIPVGEKDQLPPPGPDTFIVTHGIYYDVPGLHYPVFSGTVEVPGFEMDESPFQKKYGPSNVFYCGKNGGPSYSVPSVASQVVNQAEQGCH